MGINDLPENVLCSIFQIANKSTETLSKHPLLSISQTCSFWRTIVLRNPHLWTSIDFSRIAPEKVELWAQRSGVLPLSITYNERDCAKPKHKIPPGLRINFIIRNISRVCHLDLTVGSTSTTRLFSVAAEALETLCVRRSKLHPPAVLPYIFSKHPRLSSLTLFGIRVEWTSNIYTNLKHLDLTFGNDATVEDRDILNVFYNSPSLLSVHLSSRDPLHGALGCEGDSIPLRHLQTLTLYLLPQDISFILSSIETPRSLHTDLYAINMPHMLRDVDTTRTGSIGIELPSDPRCLSSLSMMESLTVDFEGLDFRGVSEASKFSFSVPSPSSLMARRKVFSDTLKGILLRTPFPFLTSFELCNYTDTPTHPEDICFFLSRISSISQLKFNGCTPALFTRMQIHSEYCPAPFCPKLEGLVIRNLKSDVRVIDALQSLSKNKKLGFVRFEDVRIWDASAMQAEQRLKTYLVSCAENSVLTRAYFASGEETGSPTLGFSLLQEFDD